jgi:hypothetical protein
MVQLGQGKAPGYAVLVCGDRGRHEQTLTGGGEPLFPAARGTGDSLSAVPAPVRERPAGGRSAGGRPDALARQPQGLAQLSRRPPGTRGAPRVGALPGSPPPLRHLATGTAGAPRSRSVGAGTGRPRLSGRGGAFRRPGTRRHRPGPAG